MDFLDFHNHQLSKTGIYNLNLNEEIPAEKYSAGLRSNDIKINGKHILKNQMKPEING